MSRPTATGCYGWPEARQSESRQLGTTFRGHRRRSRSSQQTTQQTRNRIIIGQAAVGRAMVARVGVGLT